MGQTFLSALVDVRRQECPRHTGGPLAVESLPLSTPIDTCRHLSILSLPVGSTGRIGSAGRIGSTGSTGFEDEDEDEDEKAPRSPPSSAEPFSLRRTSVSGDSTKRRDKVWGRSVSDKAWRQGVETK